MLNKLLYKLSGRLPCRLIDTENGPYLERYYIGKVLGVTFYLHRFVSSDSEPHIHNHPWKRGASLILTGNYVEERIIDICPSAQESGCLTEKVRRRWFNIVNGNTFHRIHDAKPGTWTLFFHGPRVKVNGECDKGWGFLERRYIVGIHDSTVFVSHTSAPSKWWKTTKTGKKIGRMPLVSRENFTFEWAFIILTQVCLVAYGWSDLMEWMA